MMCGVARLNVYLPDDLAAQAKHAGLNLSALTQQAVRRELAARSTDEWLSLLPPPVPAPVSHEAAVQALDEASTRHD